MDGDGGAHSGVMTWEPWVWCEKERDKIWPEGGPPASESTVDDSTDSGVVGGEKGRRRGYDGVEREEKGGLWV